MGAGAATIGGIALSDIATDAAIGAAIGGVGSAVTGGNVLEGAALGGVGGGIGSFAGPALGSALDIGTTGGDILAGAALGAGGSAVTGGNPLVGAALGGAGGAVQGLTAGPPTTTATGETVPGAGAVTQGGGLSASAPATFITPPPPALAAEAGGGITDLTAGGGLSGGAGTAIDSNSLANVAAAAGGAGPSNVAAGAGEGAATNYSLSSAAGYPLSGTIDTSTPLSTLGAQAAANPAAAAAPAAATAAGPTTSVDKFIADPSLASAAHVLGSNAGLLIGAGGLGYQALTQPTVPKAAQAPAVTSAQLDLAKQATAGATALEAPLTTGVLPPGAQSAINNATKAAKARVIGNYASRGMDVGKDAAGNYTNPSLVQDLNAIDQQAAGQVFQYADQLYQQGLSQAQISEGLYNAILQNTTAQNDTMSKAISNFVTAAAGGGKPSIVVNTGGAASQAA